MPHSEPTMSNNTDAAGGELPERVKAVAARLELWEPGVGSVSMTAVELLEFGEQCAALSAGCAPAAQEPDEEAEGPLREGWQVSVGPGHAGYGVYAHMTEYPEEGVVCLCTIDPNDYPDASPHPAPQQPAVRMLTGDEMEAIRQFHDVFPLAFDRIQRKFCEVNGLTIGAPQQLDAWDGDPDSTPPRPVYAAPVSGVEGMDTPGTQPPLVEAVLNAGERLAAAASLASAPNDALSTRKPVEEYRQEFHAAVAALASGVAPSDGGQHG